MKIEHRFEFVEGNFDTDTGKLECVGNYKYGRVSLCFAENTNIEFARIKLHSRDRAVDADAVYDDAVMLGSEIARRWNAVGRCEMSEETKQEPDLLALWESAFEALKKAENASSALMSSKNIDRIRRLRWCTKTRVMRDFRGVVEYLKSDKAGRA